MLKDWSLRHRVFLFFALMGLGSAAAIAIAMMLAALRIGEGALRHLVLFGGLSAFASLGLIYWVWRLFDDNVARPIETIVNDIRATVHGIDDSMVAGADPITAVLPRFHAFSRDAVLVAHNAAFDMRFLTLKQERCGLKFDNPVLDTVVLGAHLYGTAENLSLDALLARFGIEISEKDRHTALGDALATAKLFLKFIDMLEAGNIHTLSDAAAASQAIVKIRRQQAKY